MILDPLTEAYEAALEERNAHDEFSNIWRFYDGILEGLDRAIQISGDGLPGGSALRAHTKALAKRIDVIRDLHQAGKGFLDGVCEEDGRKWPCATIRALGGE